MKTAIELEILSTKLLKPGILSMVTSIVFETLSRNERIFHSVAYISCGDICSGDLEVERRLLTSSKSLLSERCPLPPPDIPLDFGILEEYPSNWKMRSLSVSTMELPPVPGCPRDFAVERLISSSRSDTEADVR